MKYSFEDLKGKNCVITGGFGVIGMALTRGLAESGVNLAVIGRNPATPDKAKAIADEFGIKCIGISASVTDKAQLELAKEQIHNEIGKIDFLINCAGGNSPKATCSVEQMTKDDALADTFYGLSMEGFQDVFDLNFIGTLLPTMVFTTDMIEAGKGNVLNISSMNSIRPLTKIPAYSAAKGSINNFTQWYAVHVAQMGIRCNAIAPGFFSTKQNAALLWNADGTPTARTGKILAATPMGRFGNSEQDIGRACVALASPDFKYMSGETLTFEGGMGLRP